MNSWYSITTPLYKIGHATLHCDFSGRSPAIHLAIFLVVYFDKRTCLITCRNNVYSLQEGDIPMLKVSEIANKLGISRGTVYYHIKKLDNHVYKDNGTIVIDREGFELIKGMIESQEPSTEILTEEEAEQTTNPDIKELRRTVESLQKDYRELISTLNDQLEEKDNQIEELTRQVNEKDRLLAEQIERKDDLLEQNNNLLQNFQVLVRENQEKIEEIEGQTEHTFWDKLRFWD